MKIIISISLFFVSLGVFGQVPICKKPTLVISTAQTVQLPATTANINMSAVGNNSDNKTIAYKWVQNSGVTVKITSPSSATTSVTGLNQVGMYVITGIATDGCGASSNANDTINVIAAAPAPPVITALSVNVGNVSNGACVLTAVTNVSGMTFWWQKSSGGNIKYSSQTQRQIAVSKMTKGTYKINCQGTVWNRNGTILTTLTFVATVVVK